MSKNNSQDHLIKFFRTIKPKYIPVLSIIFLFLSIPLTLSLVKNKQEIRSSAQVRPNVCTSSSKSGSTVSCTQSITVTINGTPPAGYTISVFTLAFYNLDNLIGPGNPNPIFFNGGHYARVDCSRNGNSCTFTITYQELNRPDENWNNQFPVNIQVNGYFTLNDGRTSAADSSCVQQFSVNRTCVTPTPTSAPTPTLAPPPPTLDPLTVSCASGLPRIHLNWNAGPTGYNDYHIYRCSGSGCTPISQIATANYPITNYTDSTVSSGTFYNYRYRIHRHSDNVFSIYSNTRGTTAPNCITPTPIPTNTLIPSNTPIPPTNTPIIPTSTPLPTSTPIPPPPTCTLNLIPHQISLNINQTQNLEAFVTNIQNGTLSRVEFSSFNTGIATVSDAQKFAPPYTTTVQGVGGGGTIIEARGVMGGQTVCSDIASVAVFSSTPTPSNTPFPTNTPVPTSTNTPTPTTIPSVTPTPTPLLANVNLTIKFQSIPPSNGFNKDPKTLLVSLVTPPNDFPDIIYENIFSVPNDFGIFPIFLGGVRVGTYDFYIKENAHLQKRFPQIDVIFQSQNIYDLTSMPLTAGDFNNDNVLNVIDISMILAQYTQLSKPITESTRIFDVNSDGVINIIDISVVLSNYTALNIPGDTYF